MKIKIRDFSENPLLRHCDISDYSGEEYYHSILNEAFKNALEKKEKLSVDLDGVAGYAPSFLDEAFGCLIYDFSKDVVSANLEIQSTEEPDWIDFLEDSFNQWEERRRQNNPPKVTQKHAPWWRIGKKGLECGLWRDCDA